MRLVVVLIGLVLILVGLFGGAMGPISWIPFIAGFIILGVGLMMDSRGKVAAKARAAQMKKYREHRSNRGY